MSEPTHSLSQLAQILSALENARRNPNSKPTAMKAIERAAAALGLATADVFAAADGLLGGRLGAEAWRAQLAETPAVESRWPVADVEPDGATGATKEEPAVSVAALPDEAPLAATAAVAATPAASEPPASVRQQLLAACRAAEHWLLAERERPGETRPDEILTVLRAAIERAEPARAPRPVRPAGEPRAPRAPRESSKEAQLIGMLRRPEGATIAQIVATTGWQAHTVRGAFAGALKKRRGLTITSDKPQGGERVYRIAE